MDLPKSDVNWGCLILLLLDLGILFGLGYGIMKLMQYLKGL